MLNFLNVYKTKMDSYFSRWNIHKISENQIKSYTGINNFHFYYYLKENFNNRSYEKLMSGYLTITLHVHGAINHC